ncbi:hypothetical protein PR202_gb04317 [Eleusine coracana subsp. coracana]|uniref:Uncharacterized protein n=1 Tax=Eleusine coracana subsp. coracana TaxID=191504 RepID=A0AAV5E4D1_ELECO|nr:hypothetical protein QOZ80_1BG0088840 [Eleusine coracana subsp. coracana]GJN17262.1 hypothetical protein PR202_gb04317 [Eleusine coracana subsp. coracana]
MPPVRRRDRVQRSSASPPYRKRWERDERRTGEQIATAALLDDALASVFSRFSDVTDVVRCASTCMLWMRIVTTRARTIAHALSPPRRWLPRSAIGVFHQENNAPTARTRRSSAPAALPCFVPMASVARFFGTGGCHPLIGPAEVDLFINSRPVASRNGLLVLELQREGHADGLRLCVCNPTSSKDEAMLLPPLSGQEKPRDYGCAVLAGNDFHPRPRLLTSFVVLLIYNRPGFTALRCYSTEAGDWGPEARSCINVPAWKLCRIGQAVVRRAVAFWPLDHGALGVRLSATAPEVTETHLLPYDVPHYRPDRRLLGVTPDDRLFFVYFGVCVDILTAKISYFAIDADDIAGGRSERCYQQEAVRMRQMRMTCQDTLKLRWVCEKSGIVLFTLGESSGLSGTFALSLDKKTVEKVADGQGHEWRNFVGYETDTAGYLASINGCTTMSMC